MMVQDDETEQRHLNFGMRGRMCTNSGSVYRARTSVVVSGVPLMRARYPSAICVVLVALGVAEARVYA